MGVHYVDLGLYGDGQLDASKPEALIYEPSVLEGQVMNLVTSPNRYNLPAFFELHVWAWWENPQGPFVDWNNHVSCSGQPSPSAPPPDPGADG
jgi:hypothetical protein